MGGAWRQRVSRGEAQGAARWTTPPRSTSKSDGVDRRPHSRRRPAPAGRAAVFAASRAGPTGHSPSSAQGLASSRARGRGMLVTPSAGFTWNPLGQDDADPAAFPFRATDRRMFAGTPARRTRDQRAWWSIAGWPVAAMEGVFHVKQQAPRRRHVRRSARARASLSVVMLRRRCDATFAPEELVSRQRRGLPPLDSTFERDTVDACRPAPAFRRPFTVSRETRRVSPRVSCCHAAPPRRRPPALLPRPSSGPTSRRS